MYPYGNYQIPQTQFDYYPYVQQNQANPERQFPQLTQLFQLPQWRQLERRVEQLERENNRIQRRLQRLNQRLRTVENRLNIPFSQFDGEF
ncbi:hypothetical protein [Bacillus sp. JJ1764]|uniref:hypothetical protein n=1 Tax=Bacillus sp. JJ1764 TaxID=3122964 RepID=UPI002FFF7AA9